MKADFNKIPPTEWQVWLGDDQIDTVFFTADCTGAEVYASLVGHDGYDPGIVVKRAAPTVTTQAIKHLHGNKALAI